jgi:cholesterol transport system auxiliary component
MSGRSAPSRRARRALRIPAAMAIPCLCALAACSGGLRSNVPPEQTYVLRAAAPDSGESAAPVPAPAATLRVSRPLALPGLGSDRIRVLRDEHLLDAYAGSRWAAPLPEVVAALAVESLRASGGFASVEDDRAPFAANYELRITLRRFEAVYSDASAAAAPTVRVSFDCAVVRRLDGSILRSFAAEAEAPAASNRMGAVIDAFESAERRAFALTVEGTRSTVAADAVPPAAPVPQNAETPVPSMRR